MKKILTAFLLVAICAMSMSSVFADGLNENPTKQERISIQEFYDLFESAKAIESDTVSEVIKLSDKEFTFRFYAEDLLGKPKTGNRYFEVYSPFVGESLYHETYVDGLLYKGYLYRGRIAETINGEYRYWYTGWLDGYDPDSGISPYSTDN